MHNRFSRALTALVVVFGLWAGSLTALASSLPAQQTGQQASAKQSSGDDKAQKEQKKTGDEETASASSGDETQPASSGAGKPLSEKEDPRLIGKRNINKGIISHMSGGLDKEVALGRQLAAEVDREAKFVDDPVVTEYVNRVGQNIVLHSDAKVPFTIKVIDSDEVNAFALPGGFFYVNKGLILAADNEAELAGVMAHETGHVCARHAMENQTKGTIAQIGLLAGSIFLGGLGGYAILNGAQFGTLLGFMKFSRENEAEADRLGVQYLYAAGYDPTAMSAMFEKLEGKEKKKPGTMSRLFASHPQPADRMEASRELVARFPEREEYVLDTSEFQRVKARLLRLSNARASTVGNIAGDNGGESGRPTLKRRQPTPGTPDATPEGDGGQPPAEKKPPEAPTLQRKDGAPPQQQKP